MQQSVVGKRITANRKSFHKANFTPFVKVKELLLMTNGEVNVYD